MRGVSALIILALAVLIPGLSEAVPPLYWSRSSEGPSKSPDAQSGDQREAQFGAVRPEVEGLDLPALCLKQSVLSIEDPVASKYGTMKGWMTHHEWGQEFRKIDPKVHPTVRIGIDGIPCARYGCCKHAMTIRHGGSDTTIVQHVVNEYAAVLGALLPWKPTSIIEGGGNIGVATALFAFMYPDAKIISLEPEPENCALLQNNTKVFKNVEVVCLGLWSKDGVSVRIKPGGDGKPWGWNLEEAPPGEKNAVQTTSIPALLKQYGLQSFDMAKLDIEGAEFNIFKPDVSIDWVDDTNAIMIELHGLMGDAPAVRKRLHKGFHHYRSGEYDVFTKQELNLAAMEAVGVAGGHHGIIRTARNRL